jgi:type IV pilus assembly protein PilA
VAHTLTQDPLRAPRQLFSEVGKKIAAIAVSYELVTYALATVQAVGLTLPTMVHGGPAEGKAACQVNMQKILGAAEQWKEMHPGFHLHRPRMSELKPLLAALPQCPDGGTYEMVYPGHTLRVQDGTMVVVPEDRVAVRCVHEHGVDGYHGGLISNPFSN